MHERPPFDTGDHYDRVTEGWRIVFGEQFHLGYFRSPADSIDQATANLTDLMSEEAAFDSETQVLDVGCGTGEPSFQLHARYGCSVTGVTVSKRGAALAQQKSEDRGLSDRLRFEHRDFLEPGLRDGSYDIVWIMEAAHLFRDKAQLLGEAYRVLKPNGALLMCDTILRREVHPAELSRYAQEISVTEKAFGRAQSKSLDFYRETAKATGFAQVQTLDVSEQVFPTMERWRARAEENRDRLLELWPEADVSDFLEACDALQRLWRGDVLGYGLVTAFKTAPVESDPASS